MQFERGTMCALPYIVEVMLTQQSLLWYSVRLLRSRNFATVLYHGTVDSRYCGHPWDCGLVSVIARVGNDGVQEKISCY